MELILKAQTAEAEMLFLVTIEKKSRSEPKQSVWLLMNIYDEGLGGSDVTAGRTLIQIMLPKKTLTRWW